MKRYTFGVYTRKHGRRVSTLLVDAKNLKEAYKAARDYVCGSLGRESGQYPRYEYKYDAIEQEAE